MFILFICLFIYMFVSLVLFLFIFYILCLIFFKVIMSPTAVYLCLMFELLCIVTGNCQYMQHDRRSCSRESFPITMTSYVIGGAILRRTLSPVPLFGFCWYVINGRTSRVQLAFNSSWMRWRLCSRTTVRERQTQRREASGKYMFDYC